MPKTRVSAAQEPLRQASLFNVVQAFGAQPNQNAKSGDLLRLKEISELLDITDAPDQALNFRDNVLHLLGSIQNLMFAVSPYLTLTEEALTNENGDNPFMRHKISLYLTVLTHYMDQFGIAEIPSTLSEQEKQRYLTYMSRFFAQACAESLDLYGETFDPSYVYHVLNQLEISSMPADILHGEVKHDLLVASDQKLSPVPRSPKAYMPVSKVSRKQLLATTEALSVDVGGGALVESQIWVDEGITLNEFDVEIQNTIGEMIQNNGDRVLTATPAQIFRECAALMDKEKVSSDMEGQVMDAVDKMLSARAVIDFSAQVQKHKRIKRQHDVDYDAVRIEGHLIEGRKLIVNAGGYSKVAYRFYDKPMYYAYSHAIGQIATINKKLLNTSASGDSAKSRKNTRDFVLLKRALAREIERMKKEAERNEGAYEPRLSYTKLQDEIGLREASEKQLRTLRADVDYLLEYWSTLGYIRTFDKYKNAHAFAGVRVELWSTVAQGNNDTHKPAHLYDL